MRLRGMHAHLASGLDAARCSARPPRVLDFGAAVVRPARRARTRNSTSAGGWRWTTGEPGAVFDWARYGRGLALAARPGETLRIEPGRAVTAYCGWYVTRVLDVKRSHGKAFAVVAGGTHHLRTPGRQGT